MSNIFRVKKSIATICVLLLAIVSAVLVSTTQASNDAVTVLVYAPNSADVVANLETVADGSEQPIQFVSASSWNETESMMNGVDALLFDSGILTESSQVLKDAFIDNALIVVGINMDGEVLAEDVGIPELYTNNWSVSPYDSVTNLQKLHADTYFAYYLNLTGDSNDASRYLDSGLVGSPSEESIENIAESLSVQSISLTDRLNTDADATKLLNMISSLASEKTSYEPTAVRMSYLNLENGTNSLQVFITVANIILLAAIVKFVYSKKQRHLKMVVLSAFAMVALIFASTVSSASAENQEYYQNSQSRTYSYGILQGVETVSNYWAEKDDTQLLVLEQIDNSIVQTVAQATPDSRSNVEYTSLTKMCSAEIPFKYGCLSMREEAEF